MDEKRYDLILSYLESGLSVVKISKLTSSSERTVRKIRDKKITRPSKNLVKRQLPPWSVGLDWDDILVQVNKKFCLKDIWESQSLQDISYSQFTREFHKRHPYHGKKVVTRRHFNPGDYVEVDYTGFKPEIIDPQTLKITRVNIFVGILCFSQRVFIESTQTAQLHVLTEGVARNCAASPILINLDKLIKK